MKVIIRSADCFLKLFGFSLYKYYPRIMNNFLLTFSRKNKPNFFTFVLSALIASLKVHNFKRSALSNLA